MTDTYVTREDISICLDRGGEVVFLYERDGYDFFLVNDNSLVYTEAGTPIYGVKY